MSEEETCLTADGFDSAIIGFARPWQAGQELVAIYDAEKCIEILMGNMECDYEEAAEFFDFNTAGAYVGPQTPIYVYRKEEE